MPKTPPTAKYWAFVSYSSKDRRWGEWLHRRLENYPIPPEFQGTELFDGAILGRNLRPIFRDRDELSGSADLGPAIHKALELSRYLIVLCSRHSAKSAWVNKEIEDFKALGRESNILALILDGVPNATGSDNVPGEEECFPPALRYPSEPLAGDLRKEGDGKERGFLKVLSGIAQLDFDVLYRRHERAQRKKRLSLAAFGTAVILVLAGLTMFAFQQKRLAEASAAAERRAAQQSREDLYFALIGAAQSAMERGSAQEVMRALAKCPETERGWEWLLLARQIRFAPIELNPADIEQLDQGALKGSGLKEAALAILSPEAPDPADADYVHGTNAEAIEVVATPGDTSGSSVYIRRRGSRIPLASYATLELGDVRSSWVSPDGSVAVILSSPLAADTHTIGSTPSGDGLRLHILPVPNDVVFFPEEGDGSAEADAGGGGEDEAETEISPEVPELLSFPDGLLVARSRTSDASVDESICLAGYPSKGERLNPLHMAAGLKPFSVAAAVSGAPVHSRPENAADGARGAEVEILAIDRSHSDRRFIRYDSSVGFSIHDLGGGVIALSPADGSHAWKGDAPTPPSVAAAFIPGRSTVALFQQGWSSIAIHDVASGSFVRSIQLSEGVNNWRSSPGSISLTASPLGNWLSLIKEDRFGRYLELFDLSAFRSFAGVKETHYVAMEWSADERFIAAYSYENQILRIERWPGREEVRSFRWEVDAIRQGERLIQKIDSADRLVVGNVLLTQSGMREILRFSGSWALGPDGDWAAFAGVMPEVLAYHEGGYFSARPEFVQIVTGLSSAAKPAPSLSDRLRELQLDVLAAD